MKKFICALMAGVIITFAFSIYSSNITDSLAQGIVRLHIIANSDSDFDQSLKLKVRDRLLSQTSADFSSKDEVCNALSLYKKIAEEVLLENGCDMDVTVQYGNFHFPTKNYDNISLPAGNYDAVRVIIGDGNGKNWWCVLFPPLCYVDEATNNSEILKSEISDKDYDFITANSTDGHIPVKIKFKIVELFNNLREEETIRAQLK